MAVSPETGLPSGSVNVPENGTNAGTAVAAEAARGAGCGLTLCCLGDRRLKRGRDKRGGRNQGKRESAWISWGFS